MLILQIPLVIIIIAIIIIVIILIILIVIVTLTIMIITIIIITIVDREKHQDAPERELEYRTPTDYTPPQTPGGLRRCSEMSVRRKQGSCRYSWITVFSLLLP